MLKNILEKSVAGCGDEHKKREQYGVIAGGVGIVCNVILCVFKFVIGYLTGSVAITADAVNNLSDAGSNVVSVAGAKLSNKPVDKEHPFGHGRMEYISALVVAFLIFLMGFELAKDSLDKIINPTETNFSIVYVIILSVAAGAKLWLGHFNNVIYKITGNINMKAVRKDCINDAISTAATVVALIVGEVTGLKFIDGAMGMAVSVIIVLAGVGIVRDILGPLLGQPPSREEVEELEKIIIADENIIGIHDLIVHDYGPGRRIASVHAEVPSDVDLIEIHDVIDNIEVQILEQMGILMCIHIDPIVLGDETVNRYKEMTREVIAEVNEKYGFHDFRMVQGPTHTNLLFDLVVPAEERTTSDREILAQVKARFKEKDDTINIVARVEHSYV
ncbi:MAG: cation transporter [Clostridia bacterium]|nr:cation transporter [Clostridia bacterium]